MYNYCFSMFTRRNIRRCRVKSGNLWHQVNSDIHLQTVEIQMRYHIRIFTVFLVNLFFHSLLHINLKKKYSLFVLVVRFHWPRVVIYCSGNLAMKFVCCFVCCCFFFKELLKARVCRDTLAIKNRSVLKTPLIGNVLRESGATPPPFPYWGISSQITP